MVAMVIRPSTVLVAVDRPAIREAITTALVAADLAVITAGNGRTAVGAVRRRRPVVVVLDVALPDIDGWTVLQRLHLAGPVPPVVLLASGDPTANGARARALGATAHFASPFPLDALVARIQAIVHPCVDPVTSRRGLATVHRPSPSASRRP